MARRWQRGRKGGDADPAGVPAPPGDDDPDDDDLESRLGPPPSAYRRRTRALLTVPGRLPHELAPGCLSLMGCLPRDAFRSFQEA